MPQLAEGPAQPLLVADVRRRGGHGPGACRRGLAGELVQPVTGARHQAHGGALPGEAERDGPPQARAGRHHDEHVPGHPATAWASRRISQQRGPRSGTSTSRSTENPNRA